MNKPSPARYRTTNWSNYTAALRKRGTLLIWLDKDMTWLAPHDGSPGRPAVFSDVAIQLSDDQGPVQAALAANDRHGGEPVEDGGPRLDRAGLFDLVSAAENTGRPDPLPARRWSAEPAGGQHRDQGPRRWRVAGSQARCSGCASTVFRVAANHCPAGDASIAERGRKVHLAMDTATSDIRAVEFTPGSDGDSPILPARSAGPIGPDPGRRRDWHRDRPLPGSCFA